MCKKRFAKFFCAPKCSSLSLFLSCWVVKNLSCQSYAAHVWGCWVGRGNSFYQKKTPWMGCYQHPILLAAVRRGVVIKYMNLSILCLLCLSCRRVLPCVCVGVDNSGSILSWETEKRGRGGEERSGLSGSFVFM